MIYMDLHMHSNYSDGKNSLEEMVETAIDLGYQTIAITDHVWKTSAWVEEYAQHIDRLNQKYKGCIQIYKGIEAKVLNLEGEIDAAPSFDRMVDLILGSIHRIPHPDGFYSSKHAGLNKEEVFSNWLSAFRQLLKNPRVDIIAHPLSELNSFEIAPDSEMVHYIANLMAQSGKIIEINVRHKAPMQELIDCLIIMKTPVVISSDSHSVNDLRYYHEEIKHYYSKGLSIIDIDIYLQTKRC